MTHSRVIRDLHRRKARERRGLALAEGVRLVEEMLSAGADCKGAVVSPALASTPRGAALRETLSARRVLVEEVSDKEMEELAATKHSQGVVAIYSPRRWTFADLAPGHGRPAVILDGVQDPGNVGTLARTALAFGCAGLIALPGTADMTNPKTLRAAMGSLFHLPHLHAEDDETLAWVTEQGLSLWATTMNGERLESASSHIPLALVFGNEGAGLRAELLARADRCIGIPIQPLAESLNVAVAAGIVLHQVTR
jgi:TrmH family RNA methyltransferase